MSADVTQLQAREQQRRLSKEELLKPAIREEEVFIESLGGSVLIRTMSHKLRQEIREAAGFGTDSWDEDRFTMLSLVNSIIDPVLSEDDIQALVEQDGQIIDELIMQITFLNMMGQAKELKKGSSETPS